MSYGFRLLQCQWHWRSSAHTSPAWLHLELAGVMKLECSWERVPSSCIAKASKSILTTSSKAFAGS
jgi:hypothetical protein